MKRYVIGLLWLMCNTVSAEEVLAFANDAQRELYYQLAAELRCPQCQNQNIADSNAIVAVDMRQKTYQLVQQGQSRQQILQYMINRYGDFVHYQPPLNRVTIWLWLAPLLLLLGLLAVGLYRRRNEAAQTPDNLAGTPDELEQLIEKYRSKKP
ncbi:cytochrome c-type biogenesis protein [Rheinheimera maricola]|uniref:Cytochrome c-type biogenesis protein n=1 Tax=Rheinheimera maricola TaxID=2793282 RepID=A0ABS7X4N1_9GAMM|nr:cytochrome c-type biogenesis protein [Rheinheimera maricola]MBZ9610266.1 cytochrome c-type biogenesis protein CcmH [Rheinheimera maricola]